MALPKGDVFTGARARFVIDNRVIGFATNCSGGEEIRYEPVEVLDNIQVQEFVAVGYTVSFQASRVRLIGRSVRSPDVNIFPKIGQNPQEHLEGILSAEFAEMNAIIEDTISKEVFMFLEQVKLASYNFNVTARGITGEDMTFVAVRMKDETEA